jgi:hypothetical protein
LLQEFLRSQKSVISAPLSQVAEQLNDVRQDTRVTQKTGVALREDIALPRGEFGSLRGDVATLASRVVSLESEMRERFGAVGERFDALEAVLGRMERDIRTARSDIASLEIGIMNAVQSALDAHRRFDSDDGDSGSAG